MEGERLLGVVERLRRRGVPVWLDGGWCVDALLGRQTRPHDDLDLVVASTGLPVLWAVLGEAGYGTVADRDGVPVAFGDVDALERWEYAVDPAGHQADVHVVTFGSAGDATYRMANGRTWTYPARAFAGRGRVLDREVPCIAADVMLACHSTGYALDAAHRADVSALADHLGVPVPRFASEASAPSGNGGRAGTDRDGDAGR